MWHHLLKENPEVKKLLDKYLSDNDHTFIEELIMPPKNLVSSFFKKSSYFLRLDWKQQMASERSANQQKFSFLYCF